MQVLSQLSRQTWPLVQKREALHLDRLEWFSVDDTRIKNRICLGEMPHVQHPVTGNWLITLSQGDVLYHTGHAIIPLLTEQRNSQ